MLYRAIAINPRDGFDLLAVWEKDGKKWYLLQLARPQSAISLYWENPKARLVFPTGVNPIILSKKFLATTVERARVATTELEQKDSSLKLTCIPNQDERRPVQRVLVAVHQYANFPAQRNKKNVPQASTYHCASMG